MEQLPKDAKKTISYVFNVLPPFCSAPLRLCVRNNGVSGWQLIRHRSFDNLADNQLYRIGFADHDWAN